MPTAQDIYDVLIKDPQYEGSHGLTREAIVEREAKRRARQHANNEKALSMAVQNSAIDKLFTFVNSRFLRKEITPFDEILKTEENNEKRRKFIVDLKEGLEGFMDSTREGATEANRKGWGHPDNPSRQNPGETAHMKTDENPRSLLSSIYQVGDNFRLILHVMDEVQREFNKPESTKGLADIFEGAPELMRAADQIFSDKNDGTINPDTLWLWDKFKNQNDVKNLNSGILEARAAVSESAVDPSHTNEPIPVANQINTSSPAIKEAVKYLWENDEKYSGTTWPQIPLKRMQDYLDHATRMTKVDSDIKPSEEFPSGRGPIGEPLRKKRAADRKDKKAAYLKEFDYDASVDAPAPSTAPVSEEVVAGTPAVEEAAPVVAEATPASSKITEDEWDELIGKQNSQIKRKYIEKEDDYALTLPPTEEDSVDIPPEEALRMLRELAQDEPNLNIDLGDWGDAPAIEETPAPAVQTPVEEDGEVWAAPDVDESSPQERQDALDEYPQEVLDSLGITGLGTMDMAAINAIQGEWERQQLSEQRSSGHADRINEAVEGYLANPAIQEIANQAVGTTPAAGGVAAGGVAGDGVPAPFDYEAYKSDRPRKTKQYDEQSQESINDLDDETRVWKPRVLNPDGSLGDEYDPFEEKTGTDIEAEFKKLKEIYLGLHNVRLDGGHSTSTKPQLATGTASSANPAYFPVGDDGKLAKEKFTDEEIKAYNELNKNKAIVESYLQLFGNINKGTHNQPWRMPDRIPSNAFEPETETADTIPWSTGSPEEGSIWGDNAMATIAPPGNAMWLDLLDSVHGGTTIPEEGESEVGADIEGLPNFHLLPARFNVAGSYMPSDAFLGDFLGATLKVSDADDVAKNLLTHGNAWRNIFGIPTTFNADEHFLPAWGQWQQERTERERVARAGSLPVRLKDLDTHIGDFYDYLMDKDKTTGKTRADAFVDGTHGSFVPAPRRTDDDPYQPVDETPVDETPVDETPVVADEAPAPGSGRLSNCYV